MLKNVDLKNEENQNTSRLKFYGESKLVFGLKNAHWLWNYEFLKVAFVGGVAQLVIASSLMLKRYRVRS